MSKRDSQNGVDTPNPFPSSSSGPDFESSTLVLQQPSSRLSDQSPSADAEEGPPEHVSSDETVSAPVADIGEDVILPLPNGPVNFHETDPNVERLFCTEEISPDWDTTSRMDVESVTAVSSDMGQFDEMADIDEYGQDREEGFDQEQLNVIVTMNIDEGSIIFLPWSSQDSYGFLLLVPSDNFWLEVVVWSP